MLWYALLFCGVCWRIVAGIGLVVQGAAKEEKK